jgi:hypothetical protein
MRTSYRVQQRGSAGEFAYRCQLRGLPSNPSTFIALTFGDLDIAYVVPADRPSEGGKV